MILTNANGCGKIGNYGGFTDLTHALIQNFIAAAIAGNTSAAGTVPFNQAAGPVASWILCFVTILFLVL